MQTPPPAGGPLPSGEIPAPGGFPLSQQDFGHAVRARTEWHLLEDSQRKQQLQQELAAAKDGGKFDLTGWRALEPELYDTYNEQDLNLFRQDDWRSRQMQALQPVPIGGQSVDAAGDNAAFDVLALQPGQVAVRRKLARQLGLPGAPPAIPDPEPEDAAKPLPPIAFGPDDQNVPPLRAPGPTLAQREASRTDEVERQLDTALTQSGYPPTADQRQLREAVTHKFPTPPGESWQEKAAAYIQDLTSKVPPPTPEQRVMNYARPPKPGVSQLSDQQKVNILEAFRQQAGNTVPSDDPEAIRAKEADNRSAWQNIHIGALRAMISPVVGITGFASPQKGLNLSGGADIQFGAPGHGPAAAVGGAVGTLAMVLTMQGLGMTPDEMARVFGVSAAGNARIQALAARRAGVKIGVAQELGATALSGAVAWAANYITLGKLMPAQSARVQALIPIVAVAAKKLDAPMLAKGLQGLAAATGKTALLSFGDGYFLAVAQNIVDKATGLDPKRHLLDGAIDSGISMALLGTAAGYAHGLGRYKEWAPTIEKMREIYEQAQAGKVSEPEVRAAVQSAFGGGTGHVGEVELTADDARVMAQMHQQLGPVAPGRAEQNQQDAAPPPGQTPWDEGGQPPPELPGPPAEPTPPPDRPNPPPAVNAPATGSGTEATPPGGAGIPVIETPGQTPANDQGGAAESEPDNVPPPRKPGNRQLRPFGGIKDIENRLTGLHDQMFGADDADLQEGEGERGLSNYANGTVWKGKRYPEEIKKHLIAHPELKSVLGLSEHSSETGGEDAFAGMGAERYVQALLSLVGRRKSRVDNAKTKLAGTSPEAEFLIALHDNWPAAKDRKALTVEDPKAMPTGTTFEVQGHQFEIVEDADGYRVLKDGEEFPVLPADEVGQIPVDKGTLEVPESENTDSGKGPVPDDPFGDLMNEPDVKPDVLDTAALQKLLDRYDAGGEMTIGDLVDQVEALDHPGMADAVRAFRQEQEDDRQLSGRNDMDAAEERFIEAIQGVLGEAEPDDTTPALPIPEKPEGQSMSWYQWRQSIQGLRLWNGKAPEVEPTGRWLELYNKGLKPAAAAIIFRKEQSDKTPAATAKEPWQMMPHEFAQTPGATDVPKGSVLALRIDQMSTAELRTDLEGRSQKELQSVAIVLHVPKSGTKAEVIERITQAISTRKFLANQTVASLQKLPAKDLRGLVRRLGLYSGGNHFGLASQLIGWRDTARTTGKRAISDAKHFALVSKAQEEGKPVPPEVLKAHKLDATPPAAAEPAKLLPPKENDADLIIVGCVKGKIAGDDRVAAKDLYQSDLFNGRRGYAEATGKPWMILSARHGLVHPDVKIPPYDATLDDLTPEEIKALDKVVADKLAAMEVKRGATIEVHAGSAYVKALFTENPYLTGRGYKFRLPMAGMGIGEQKAAYNAVKEPAAADEPAPPPTKVADPVAPKLRKLADGLTKQIEDKRREMTQNPTPKRMKEYRARRWEADNMERLQRALHAIADAREAGTLPKMLEKLNNKGQIAPLVYKGLDTSRGGYYDIIPSDKYTMSTPEALAVQALIDKKSPEQQARDEQRKKAEHIARLEDALRFQKIEGFFPTPPALVERMVREADIEPGMSVLEPSAGTGSLAEGARDAGGKVDVVELRPSMQEILKLKDFPLVGGDFTDLVPGKLYDRIVMNPPFEKGQDAEHVMLAYKHLAPGGKLLAIVSEGPFIRSDKKSVAFRQWLEPLGDSESLGNPFSDIKAFRQTGVNVRLLTIERPTDEPTTVAGQGDHSQTGGDTVAAPGADQAPGEAADSYTPSAADAQALATTAREWADEVGDHFEAGPDGGTLVKADGRRIPVRVRPPELFPKNVNWVESLIGEAGGEQINDTLRVPTTEAEWKALTPLEQQAIDEAFPHAGVFVEGGDIGPAGEIWISPRFVRDPSVYREEWFHSEWNARSKPQRDLVLGEYGDEEKARKAFEELVNGKKPVTTAEKILAGMLSAPQQPSPAMDELFKPKGGGGGKSARRGRLSIRAWHGSPHDFDRFELVKIGSGEGAQAYGWGLYFSSRREVAESYRNRLAGRLRLLYEGGHTTPNDLHAIIERDLAKARRPELEEEGPADIDAWKVSTGNSIADEFLYQFQNAMVSPEEAVDATMRRFPEQSDAVRGALMHIAYGIERGGNVDKPTYRPVPRGGLRADREMTPQERRAFWEIVGRLGWRNPEKMTPEQALADVREQLNKTVAAQREHMEWMKKRGYDVVTDAYKVARSHWLDARRMQAVLDKFDVKVRLDKPLGRLYDVELAPDDGELLDYDRPFSEQSAKVQAALQQLGVGTLSDSEWFEGADGAWIWNDRGARGPSRMGSVQPRALEPNYEKLPKFANAIPKDAAGGYWVHTSSNSEPPSVHNVVGWAPTLERAKSMLEDHLAKITPGGTRGREWTGQELYAELQRKFQREPDVLPDWLKGMKVSDPTRASMAMRAAGIRGMKYLDQNSRQRPGVYEQDGHWLVNGKRYETKAAAEAAADEGLTHNYVIFDDRDITVRGKMALRRKGGGDGEGETNQPDEGGRQPADAGAAGGGGAGRPKRPGIRVADEGNLPEARTFVGPDSYQAGLDTHQQYGVNLALSRFQSGGTGFLLADGTGVGKTRELLAIADTFQRQRGDRVLIVTQNKQIIAGSFTADAAAMGIDLAKLEIGTFDDLKGGKVGVGQYGLAIFDEAHNLKNIHSDKSQAGQGVKADHRLFATATPLDRPVSASYFMAAITGRAPAEVQALLGFREVKGTNAKGEPTTFAELVPGFSWQKVMDSMMALRRAAVANGAMIRREYPFFGSIDRDTHTFDDRQHAQQKRIDRYWQIRISQAKSPQAKRNMAGQRIFELSRWTESTKIPHMLARIQEELAAGRQVVLVAEGINDTDIKGLTDADIKGMSFQEIKELPGVPVRGMIGALAEKLAELKIPFARIYGTGPKGPEVARFQDGKVQVALATPQSGGTGINLDDVVGDRPRTMLVATPNFAGDVYDQLTGRVSRRNTASEAKIRFTINDASISDARRRDVLMQKFDALRKIQVGGDLDAATFDPNDNAPRLARRRVPKEERDKPLVVPPKFYEGEAQPQVKRDTGIFGQGVATGGSGVGAQVPMFHQPNEVAPPAAAGETEADRKIAKKFDPGATGGLFGGGKGAVRRRPPDDDEELHTGVGRSQAGPPPIAAATWAGQPPETEGGRKLIKRIREDTAGTKVGARSIVEFVNEAASVPMHVGKAQTTRRHPAHYKPVYHIVRTRSGAWHLNVHEAGHAISAILRDYDKDWHRGLGQKLIDLTQQPGSFASAKSPEEGVAEWARLYVTNPGQIDPKLNQAMQNALAIRKPQILKILRDAHRAWLAHTERSLPAQLGSYTNDRQPPRPVGQVLRDLWDTALFHMVNAEVAIDRVDRRLFHAVRSFSTSLAREFRSSIGDTPADFRNAFQTTARIPQEVNRALFGADKGREGLRILATDWGWENLERGDRDILRRAGFELPKASSLAHGDFLYLSDESIRQIYQRIGKQDWPTFETYGQMRAALHRFESKGHSYPGLTEGFTPAAVRPWLKEMEAAHPTWGEEFKKINRYMDQLLLVAVHSGEIDIPSAVRIKLAWEDYWPLPRQRGEEGAGRRSGGGTDPTAGIRRAWGSDAPFENVIDAIERRTKMALESYYQNRLMLAVHQAGVKLSRVKELPYELRASGLQLMLPLRLDVKKVATLTDPEQQKIIADYLNEQKARELGIPVEQLEPADVVKPDDVEVTTPGVKIFRRTRPRAVRIVAPFQRGKRAYFQVTDPLLYDLYARSDDPNRAIQALSRVGMGVVRPWKRVLTQNIVFTLRNVLARDPITAVSLGNGARSLVPGFYAAAGIVNRLKGDPFNVTTESELLSKALDATHTQAHLSYVERFKAVLAEGLVVPEWSQMNMLDKALELPGQMMAAAMKPIELMLWATGQRDLSALAEEVTREGAGVQARQRGQSDEAVAAAADRITGNFGMHAANANVAAVYRMAGFLNPGLQILYQHYQRFTDPDPGVRTRQWARIGWLAAIGAVAAAINFLMTDEEGRKRLRERPDPDRFKEAAVVGRFRFPFENGIPGAAMSFGWNSVESRLLGDKIGGDQYARQVLQQAASMPGPLDSMHPWLRAYLEERANYSFYRDAPIVPPWMAEAFPNNPEMQAYPSTPATYKAIGALSDTSPIKVQYAVATLFTSQMDDAVRLLERIAGNKEIRVQEAADVPLVGRLFLRDPIGWSGKSVKEASQLEVEYQGVKKKVKALNERSDQLDAGERRQLDRLNQRIDELEGTARAMKFLRRQWAGVKRLEKQPASDERDAQIADIKRQMNTAAREALGKEPLAGVP